jgi:hypothetical protein
MSRKLKPCDLVGDMEIVPGEQFTMLWAHGSVATNNFQGVTYHGLTSRGSASVTLLAEQVQSAAADDEQTANAPAAAASAATQQQQASDAEMIASVYSFMQGSNASPEAGAPIVCTSSDCDASAQPSAGDRAAAAVAVQAGKYTPPAVTNNPDGTFSVEVRCPRTVLPAKETIYMVCYVEVPSDQ